MPTVATSPRVVKNAVAITEWYTRVGGDIEACGEAAVAMALHVVRGTSTDPQFVTQLAQEAVAAKEVADYPHVSTSPKNLAWLLKKHGASSVIHWRDWESALRASVGQLPVIVGVNNATAFGGHDRNVHGHYVTVFGTTPQGAFVVGDPNTPESTQGQFMTYSLAQFHAADPFAAIVPLENPLGSIPVVGTALDAVISPVNAQIRQVSGFTGIVEAIAADEVIQSPNLGSIVDLPGYMFTNFRAWLLRALVILIGLLLIIGVLLQTMKQADPAFWQSLSTTGAGIPPGMVGGGDASGGADAGGAAAGEGAALPAEAVMIA